MLLISEKIRAVMRRKGKTGKEFAAELGCSWQNVYLKLKRNNWSDEDLKKYAGVLGCDYEVTFIDKVTGERF